MVFGDLIIDLMFILIAIGFGPIGLFITHITGDGLIGILITTMDGTDHITLGTVGTTDHGTIRTTVITYGVYLEVTVI